jgi:hypothetical protein
MNSGKEGPVRRSIAGPFPVAVTPIETPRDGSDAEFRHLLAIEHKRSERTGRPCLLLLVDLQDHRGVSLPIDPTVSAKLFAGLRLALRDTDVVGWYVANRVAGAVLTDLADGSRAHVSRVVRQTVTRILTEQLPQDVVPRLQVRVHASPDPGRTGGDTH